MRAAARICLKAMSEYLINWPQRWPSWTCTGLVEIKYRCQSIICFPSMQRVLLPIATENGGLTTEGNKNSFVSLCLRCRLLLQSTHPWCALMASSTALRVSGHCLSLILVASNSVKHCSCFFVFSNCVNLLSQSIFQTTSK